MPAAVRTLAAVLLAVAPCAAQVPLPVGPLPDGGFILHGGRLLPPADDAPLGLPKFKIEELAPARPALRAVDEIERELRPPVKRPVQVQVQRAVGFNVNRIANLVVLGDDAEAEDGGTEEKPAAASSSALQFADGSRLHGTLEGLDAAKKEIVWRGDDASAPITFPLAQVSHFDFSGNPKPEGKVRATIKLAGGDWLAADVTGLHDGRLQLKLGDGTALAVDRTRIEWVYFSKTAAPEIYDGPQNISGWVSTGGWTYREGALRAAQPSSIGRMFEVLPDQAEYRFEFDQGDSTTRAFAVMLHGPNATARGLGGGMLRLMVNDQTLQLWSHRGDNVKQEQVDLAKILPAPPKMADGSPAKRKPTRWRIFEDRVSGRLVVFIDGRKVGDWNTGKGKAGENRGCFVLQPMAWGSGTEQSLAKIRVAPWDGYVPVDDALEGVRPKMDQVVLADGDMSEGRIESVTGDKVKLGAELLAREKITLLRFARPETVPDEEPAVARVRLVEGGEFDVAAVAYQDGKLRVRTNFGGVAALPVAALRGVEFAHLTPLAGPSTDVLVFKNGDRLRGVLESGGTGQKMRWRAAPAAPPVEMDVARIAGVLVAPRGELPPAKAGVLARCRNGDAFAGDFVALDKDVLTLESGPAGRLAIPRDAVTALYFASDGKLPALDGASDHEVWEAGLDFNRGGSALRLKNAGVEKAGVERKTPVSLWSYFDGMFSVKRPAANRANAFNNGNFNLGRIVEGLAARVDFSFDVIGRKNQVFFAAFLFSEPDSPGYMMQFHQAGLFIYDTGGPQRGRAMVQQQQIQFGEKVKADAAQHRIRVLADRTTGRMTVLVDDVVVGNFGPKGGGPPRNLARGLALQPQQNAACTFANLRVAPWNGQVPGLAPAAATDSVLLANGDEAQGTVGSATPEALQLESEVGVLDLPMKRLAMVEFGARVPEAATGVRLRLSDRSAFTVSTYRIENATLVCQSAVAGEIRLPLGALKELVFAMPALPAAEKADEKVPQVRPVGGGLIIRGNGRVIID